MKKRQGSRLVRQNVCHFTKRQDWIAVVGSAVTWKPVVSIIEQDTITMLRYCLRSVNVERRTTLRVHWCLQQGAGSRGLSRKWDSTRITFRQLCLRVVERTERRGQDRKVLLRKRRVIRRRYLSRDREDSVTASSSSTIKGLSQGECQGDPFQIGQGTSGSEGERKSKSSGRRRRLIEFFPLLPFISTFLSAGAA